LGNAPQHGLVFVLGREEARLHAERCSEWMGPKWLRTFFKREAKLFGVDQQTIQTYSEPHNYWHW